MQQSILAMGKDLVMAQIQAGQLPPDEMPKALRQTFASLMALKAQEESGVVSTAQEAERASGTTDWKKSIGRYTVTCLECGATFKQLTVRHLREHGLEARSYRTKYGIPRTQALSAREVTAKRRQIVQRIRPWEKAPRGRQRRRQPNAE